MTVANSGQAPTAARWRRSPLEIAFWIIAILPFVHVFVTWDLDGKLSQQAHLLRHHSIAILAGEFAVIWLAARNGLDLRQLFRSMPVPVIALLSCWAVIAFAAALLDPDRCVLSALMTLRFVLHGLFFAALMSLVKEQERRAPLLPTTPLMVGAVAYLLALVAFVLLIPDPNSFPWVLRLPSGTNVRQVGNIFGILAMVPMMMLLLGKGRWLPIFLLAMSLVTFIAWSGTRGAIAGLVAGCICGIAANRQAVSVKRGMVALAALLLGITASVPLPRPAPEFGIIRMVSAMSPAQDISAGRMEVWKDTIAEIRAAPITGYGSGRFRDNMFEHNGFHYNHPHNIFLQFAYDWGFAGGGAALLLIALLGWAIWKRSQIPSDARFLAVAGFTSIIAISMIEGTLFHALPMVLGMAMIAPAFALRRA